MHIHSHTSLPGFFVEGNAYVDSLVAATAVKTVPNVLPKPFCRINFFTKVLRHYSNNLSYHTVNQTQFFFLALIVASLIFHNNMVLTPEVYSLYKNGTLMLQKCLNLVV